MLIREVDLKSEPIAGLASELESGAVIILRNIDAIRNLRQEFVRFVANRDSAAVANLLAFYESSAPLTLDTLVHLSHAIKEIRLRHLVSEYLAPLIEQLGFAPPVRLDGAIPRLVLGADLVAQARASGRFPQTDFQRQSADGFTEVFMPRPANIHRDYNRTHYLFQCNMWFPLHAASAKEVVRIFPQLYRLPVFDMDAAPENFSRLGEPLHFELNFGDAVFFHGEHLHTSPESDVRRQSYDLRIASHCFDDTKHYRQGFLDLRNFLVRRSPEQSINWLLGELASDSEVSSDKLTSILSAFEQAPFCEDRYLILAETVLLSHPEVAMRALEAVVKSSVSWFWLLKAGEKLVQLRAWKHANRALELAIKEAGCQGGLPEFMPVQYNNPPSQLLPEQVPALAAKILGEVRCDDHEFISGRKF